MKEILLILRGLLAEKFEIEYDVFYNLPLLKMGVENLEQNGRSGSFSWKVVDSSRSIPLKKTNRTCWKTRLL